MDLYSVESCFLSSDCRCSESVDGFFYLLPGHCSSRRIFSRGQNGGTYYLASGSFRFGKESSMHHLYDDFPAGIVDGVSHRPESRDKNIVMNAQLLRSVYTLTGYIGKTADDEPHVLSRELDHVINELRSAGAVPVRHSHPGG